MTSTARLINILRNVGLSEKEAGVYVAALRLGSARVADLSAVSGIKRTTVYPLLVSLKAAGLITEEIHGFKVYYRAAEPSQLETLIEERRGAFRDVVGELNALYHLKGASSSIRCHEGKAAVKALYEDLLKRLRPRDLYFAISNHEAWASADPHYFEHYKERRAKTGAQVKLLLQDTPAARKSIQRSGNLGEAIRILPKHIILRTNTVVSPWCVVLHQLVAPIMTIVIENPHVVSAHKQHFEIMWEGCPGG